MRKPILFMFAMLISSCTSFPQIADDIEKIANNDAITIKVDKDAFVRDTDVIVEVRVINKDQPTPEKP